VNRFVLCRGQVSGPERAGLDCNTAYAMSKKALQDSVLRQIEERTVALDERLPAGMSDPGNRRARDRHRQEIMHKR